MSHELIAILMFSSMMLMMMTGQRVFGAIGGVAAIAALTLWGVGGSDIPFTSAMAQLLSNTVNHLPSESNNFL